MSSSSSSSYSTLHPVLQHGVRSLWPDRNGVPIVSEFTTEFQDGKEPKLDQDGVAVVVNTIGSAIVNQFPEEKKGYITEVRIQVRFYGGDDGYRSQILNASNVSSVDRFKLFWNTDGKDSIRHQLENILMKTAVAYRDSEAPDVVVKDFTVMYDRVAVAGCSTRRTYTRYVEDVPKGIFPDNVNVRRTSYEIRDNSCLIQCILKQFGGNSKKNPGVYYHVKNVLGVELKSPIPLDRIDQVIELVAGEFGESGYRAYVMWNEKWEVLRTNLRCSEKFISQHASMKPADQTFTILLQVIDGHCYAISFERQEPNVPRAEFPPYDDPWLKPSISKNLRNKYLREEKKLPIIPFKGLQQKGGEKFDYTTLHSIPIEAGVKEGLILGWDCSDALNLFALSCHNPRILRGEKYLNITRVDQEDGKVCVVDVQLLFGSLGLSLEKLLSMLNVKTLKDVVIMFNDLIYSASGRTKQLISSMKVGGYYVQLSIPSLAFELWSQTLPARMDIYHPSVESEEKFIRSAVIGARIDLRRNVKFKSDGLDDWLVDLDVTSLYPWVMKNNYYPVGKPRFLEKDAEIEYKAGKFGIYDVMIEIPNGLDHLPVPCRYDGKLNWTTRTGVFAWSDTLTSVDIDELINAGCKVEFPGRCVVWDKKSKIFTKFVDRWYSIKEHAAENKNEPFKRFAKIVMNCLYGKFLQPFYKTSIQSTVVKTADEYMKLKNEETILKRTVKGDSYEIIYEKRKERNQSDFRPVQLAVFIFAYARKHMNKILKKIDYNYYYFHTDGMVIHFNQCHKLRKAGFISTDGEFGKLRIVGGDPSAVITEYDGNKELIGADGNKCRYIAEPILKLYHQYDRLKEQQKAIIETCPVCSLFPCMCYYCDRHDLNCIPGQCGDYPACSSDCIRSECHKDDTQFAPPPISPSYCPTSPCYSPKSDTDQETEEEKKKMKIEIEEEEKPIILRAPSFVIPQSIPYCAPVVEGPDPFLLPPEVIAELLKNDPTPVIVTREPPKRAPRKRMPRKRKDPNKKILDIEMPKKESDLKKSKVVEAKCNFCPTQVIGNAVGMTRKNGEIWCGACGDENAVIDESKEAM